MTTALLKPEDLNEASGPTIEGHYEVAVDTAEPPQEATCARPPSAVDLLIPAPISDDRDSYQPTGAKFNSTLKNDRRRRSRQHGDHVAGALFDLEA